MGVGVAVGVDVWVGVIVAVLTGVAVSVGAAGVDVAVGARAPNNGLAAQPLLRTMTVRSHASSAAHLAALLAFGRPTLCRDIKLLMVLLCVRAYLSMTRIDSTRELIRRQGDQLTL